MLSPIIKQSTDKICYMIMPQGIKEDLSAGLEVLSEKYGVSIVVIGDVDGMMTSHLGQLKECSKKRNLLEDKQHHF